MQSGESLEDQLVNKEREWKDLMSATVSRYKKAQDECNFYRTRYERLKEDFQFNLAILDERDRELARYDRLTAKALTVNQNRQREQEHIHVQAGAHRAMYIKEKEKEVRKSQYRLHLNKIICCMTDEALKLTMDHEKLKCDLQDKIHELERQHNIQRQNMTAAFQKELRDQKHYFNMKMDDMQALLSSQDLKTTQDLSVSKQFHDHIQTQLQHKEQHMKNVKDSRIKDLEDKLTMMEMKMKEEEEKYVKKYQDVLKALKDSELQQEVRCRAQSHHLQKAEKRILKLQKNMEALHDTIKKKEKTIHWYEQQLSDSLEREKNLEIMRTQIELEWQRCCENMKTERYSVNEQLMKGLTQNKNQAKEEVMEKVEDLQDLTVVPPSTNKRDQSVQCLNPTEDSEKICLQKHNAELQVMVSQMRKDMEALLLQYQVQSQASFPRTSHYGLSPQIYTHLSPQTSSIHHKISQANVEDSSTLHKQGGLWPEKNDNVTLMSLVGTEKLEEEKQQHSSDIISGAKLKNVQGHSVQRVRLKRAAHCITRLIEEKQHLIEMCNRLRGMTSSSGLKELDFSTEKQHHNVTDLEQRQCQLATQEHQCKGGASHLTEQEEAAVKETTANPPSQETGRPEIARNPLTQSEVKQTQSSVSVDPNLCQSIESLQSIWDLVDHGLSSSTLSEGDEERNRTDPAESGAAGNGMMVCGVTAPVHSQPDKPLQKRNLCTTAKKTTSTLRPRPKIRNYNIKD